MNEKNELVVVAGADGFIGGSLVADLRRQGYTRIRAVGIQADRAVGISTSPTSKMCSLI